MEKILFVCTGNTCRSSMAEGILKSILKKNDSLRDKYIVTSAGIYASEGDCASSNAVSVLSSEWDIDISGHRSKNLSKELIDEASIILTMTRNHKEAILSKYPHAKPKIYTLKEFVSEEKPDQNIEAYNFTLDIMDPYGMPVEVYRRCAVEIKTSIERLVRILERFLQ